jgi:hypothetical protein
MAARAAVLGLLVMLVLEAPGLVDRSPSAVAASRTTTAQGERAVLAPDLAPLRAADIYVQRTAAGRRLRFESSLANLGPGPLEVRPNRNRPCPRGQQHSTQLLFKDANDDATFTARRDTAVTRRSAGCMVFHPKHDHWHFNASARYRLLDPRAEEEQRVVVSSRRKVSFCLRDSARVPRSYGMWDYAQSFFHCTAKSPQGISVGWMDTYQSFLAGQTLPLPEGTEDGLYCLSTVVDPLDQVVEADDENNSSIKAFVLRGDRVLPREAERCRAVKERA